MEKGVYKVIAYDPTPLITEGLKNFFVNYENYELLSTFNDFYDLLDFCQKNSDIDIVIFETEIPNKSGIDGLRYFHDQFPKPKIIVITDKKSEYDIFSTIKAGANAYLYKPNTTKQILLEALEAVSKGEEYFNEPISNIIIQSYVKSAKKGREISHRNPQGLTPREIQILQLVSQGLTNKQIADGLFISVRTVDAHKNHIMKKLGLKNTAELVKFAIKHGYVKL